MKKIAIQGQVGSFHDIAAHTYFSGEAVELVCCETFEEVFAATAADDDTVGLVAIENTIAGSLLHNYELLRGSRLCVAGEQKLHISHCICCLPADDWTSIEEVNSHPVALSQCRSWLEGHPTLRVTQASDTAGAAKTIAERNLRGRAAICSRGAAELYGLKVLEDHIEDNKHNFTRFLLVCRPDDADQLRDADRADKASLVFTLPHEEGSLSSVLSILSFYRMSLTKIQSLPIIGREWEYLFYIDVTYKSPRRFQQSIDAIRPLTKELTILGEYNDGPSA